MADYFTYFSVVLKLQGAPPQKYALDLAGKVRRHRFEEEPLPPDFPAGLEPVLEDWNFETEENNDGIWLHTDSGGVDAACAFIQHLLQKFDPAGRVSFEWSNDCSKPRIDAYGGGAAIITARKIKSMSTTQWLRKNAA